MITFDPVAGRVVDGAIASQNGPEAPFMPLTVDKIIDIDYTLNGIDDEFCLTVTDFPLEDR
jgi:hypothetical protein